MSPRDAAVAILGQSLAVSLDHYKATVVADRAVSDQVVLPGLQPDHLDEIAQLGDFRFEVLASGRREPADHPHECWH